MDNGFSFPAHPNGGAIPKTGKNTFYTSDLGFEDNFNPTTYINNQEPKLDQQSKQKATQKPSKGATITTEVKKHVPTKSDDKVSNDHHHKQLGSPLMCYALRLKHGDELRKCLLSFVKKNGLKGAFVMTCVGSCTSARIRLASATPENEANYVSIHYTKILSTANTIIIFPFKMFILYYYRCLILSVQWR